MTQVSRLGDWEKAADAINRNAEILGRSWALRGKMMNAFFHRLSVR